MTKQANHHCLMTSPLRSLLMILSVFALALSSPLSHATKLYKWVDANGTISYQDRPPPKNAKILEEREINAQRRIPVVVKPDPVIVYTVDDCQRCDEVVKWLENRGIPTEARLLKDDRDAQRRILDLSNGLTVPTLFIDQQIVTDSSEEAMITALREADYQITLPEADEADELSNETQTANRQLDANPLDSLDTTEVDNANLTDDELLEQLSEFEPSQATINDEAEPLLDASNEANLDSEPNLAPLDSPSPSDVVE